VTAAAGARDAVVGARRGQITRSVATLAVALSLAASTVPAGGQGPRPGGTTLASSEKRIALVVGNAAYAVGRLNNPVNDARAMAQALRAAGFDVVLRENADRVALYEAINEFGDRFRAAKGIGLFYFSGHGLQVQGRNFMVPLGARITSERMVEAEAIDVNRVLAEMDAAQGRINVVILDACRDNPYARSFRSGGQGLAQIDAPRGTLVAYATAPGKVAEDGREVNSPYTAALVRHMQSPGLPVESVFKRVRIEVLEKTANRQEPWEASSLTGDFFFYPTMATARPVAPTAPTIREEQRQPVGSIALAARIDGIGVWLGDRWIGDTRSGQALIVENLTAGTYRLTARKQGHKNWEREIHVAANQRAEVSIDIEPLRPEPPRDVRGEDVAEMVLVPAGEFWMGGDDGESHEKPRHRVYLDPFHIDKYEITNRLYQRFISATGHREPRSWNDSRWNDPQQPVVGVSWHDAEAYCRWAGKRLPTEAEWEKAARGTDGRQYPWGEQWDASRANSTDTKRGRTAPVGSYPSGASPYGVQDMAGNVWEWVADWFDANYYGASPERNPRGPDFGAAKVLRGGSWYHQPPNLRSSLRTHFWPDNRFDDFGFRCAKGLP
jgi:formylglycine-generating enzyme required for sulfatase activity